MTSVRLCPDCTASPAPGERCELSTRSDRCVPGVCKNGGTCVNLLVGGFKCECPAGSYEKPYCQMNTRSFPPNSFLTFRGLRQRFHFTLSLTYVWPPCRDPVEVHLTQSFLHAHTIMHRSKAKPGTRVCLLACVGVYVCVHAFVFPMSHDEL